MNFKNYLKIFKIPYQYNYSRAINVKYKKR